ncbi:hypothetical protein AM501_04335 [Aneurinibacillus migulanus]|uniref:hypothetical protein n=1 Tax=Aneurinibacillus migulanus TaxID=47500 RepID=UPI0005BD7784|nr:hypothetical protein [Aneurinibacillus migulanus]KIV56486.1 hypothetical protein TS64_09500 [Aneurinibacillus migulanus]KPD09418.1 hypothetical protein AM501_04335 [Aneurinibacillus migulanus]
MNNKVTVKRRISESVGSSAYKVIGLLLMKPEIDTFTSSVNYEMVCEIGSVHNPLNFLSYFHQAREISA